MANRKSKSDEITTDKVRDLFEKMFEQQQENLLKILAANTQLSLCKKNQKIFFVGDFNINSLDYANNSKVKGFIDGMFSKGLISSDK